MEYFDAFLKPTDGRHKQPQLTNDLKPSQERNLSALAEKRGNSYIAAVKWLTKQEQTVLIIVLGLLLTGWAVKLYRTAHPPETIAAPVAAP